MRARTVLSAGLACLIAVTALSVAPAQAAPKPERHVSSKVVNMSQQDLAFRGKVFGHLERPYANRVTRLQKKTCRSCGWDVIRKRRTNDAARFDYDIGAPRRGKWFFRVAVPGTRDYRRSFSKVWYTQRV